MSSSSFYHFDTPNECSQLNDCSSCVQNAQCGYCFLSHTCVPGNWLGPTDMEICSGGRLQYYYGQCTISHKPIMIAGTSIASLIVFTIFVLFLRCCLRSRTAEYRPLLPTSGAGMARRSSTFYQFNRNVPGSRKKPSLTERPWPNARRASSSVASPIQGPGDDDNSGNTEIDVPNRNQDDYKAVRWDERRKELLKKYGKSPDH